MVSAERLKRTPKLRFKSTPKVPSPLSRLFLRQKEKWVREYSNPSGFKQGTIYSVLRLNACCIDGLWSILVSTLSINLMANSFPIHSRAWMVPVKSRAGLLSAVSMLAERVAIIIGLPSHVVPMLCTRISSGYFS